MESVAGKRSRPSRRMRKTQFYVYGKRPIRHSPKLNQFKSQSSMTLRWRHNDHAGVSNHQPHGCLLNRLFGRTSKKTPKLRVTGLCAGNSPGTGEFPAQMASYAENVSIWWRHHGHNSWQMGQEGPFQKHVLYLASNNFQVSLTYRIHIFQSIGNNLCVGLRKIYQNCPQTVSHIH